MSKDKMIGIALIFVGIVSLIREYITWWDYFMAFISIIYFILGVVVIYIEYKETVSKEVENERY